jgi:hypothetical protein
MSKLLAAPALLLALLLAPAGCDVDDGGDPNTPRDDSGESPDKLADTDGDATGTDGDDTDGDECSLRGVLLPPVTGGGPIGDC